MLNLAQLAAVLGRTLESTQQDFKKPNFRKLGQVHGRERLFGLADFVLIRLIYELQAPARTLDDAFGLAGGLARPLVDIITGPPGPEWFAILLEGTKRGAPNKRLLAVGREELCQAVMSAADDNWPRVSIVNMTEIAQEILISWAFSEGSGPALEAKFKAELEGEEREEALRICNLLRARLAGRPRPPKTRAAGAETGALATDELAEAVLAKVRA